MNQLPLPTPALPVAGAQPQFVGSIPSIDAHARAAYDNMFFQLVSGEPSGLLQGGAAKPFFLKSNLPQAQLAAIWGLADINKDGALDREEFAIAYHLCTAALKGFPIPPSLPQYLVPQSKLIYFMSNASKQEDWVNVHNTVNASTYTGQQQYTMPVASALLPQSSFTSQTSVNYQQYQIPTPQQPQQQYYQPPTQQQQPQQQYHQPQQQPQYQSTMQPAYHQSSVFPSNVAHQYVQNTNPPNKDSVQSQFNSSQSSLFFDGPSTDSTGQLVFVPAPLEVKGKDIDASNSYALGAGVSFEQRVALSSELGDAMKKIQQKRANN